MAKSISNPVSIKIKCIQCGHEYTITVDKDDYNEYFVKGEGLVQTVFPYLTADQRELIISHICGSCFDKIFSGEED